MTDYRDLNDLAEKLSAKHTYKTSAAALQMFRKNIEGFGGRVFFTTFRRASDGRYTVFFFPSEDQIQTVERRRASVAINLSTASGGRIISFRA